MKKGFVKINKDLCKGCGLCIVACPKKGIRISEKRNMRGYHPAEYIEDENSPKRKCNACTLCAIVCPDVAIEVFRE